MQTTPTKMSKKQRQTFKETNNEKNIKVQNKMQKVQRKKVAIVNKE